MNKQEKQQYIENLDTMSKDYSALFVASFSEMSVKDMINFRTEIRNNDGVAKVSKNNIVKIFINRDEQKKKSNVKFPPFPNKCPDYWEVKGDGLWSRLVFENRQWWI